MHETTNLQKRRRPLSVWELPTLLRSVHEHRNSKPKNCKERRHVPAILAFVYRNRFAVANQIQRRFPQYLPSDRTARRRLAEMEALGYLGVVATNNTSPLWPKVYQVTKRGLSRLRQAHAKQTMDWAPTRSDRSRSNGFSAQHVVHEILVTEFMLQVWLAGHERPNLELPKIERRSLIGNPAFRVAVNGKQSWLAPDALFVIRRQEHGMMCCLVEVDTCSMSNRQLTKKLSRYAAWTGSPSGQQFLVDLYRRFGASKPKAAFRLLIVACDPIGQQHERRMLNILRAGNKAPCQLRDRIWLTHAGVCSSAAEPGIKALHLPKWMDCQQHENGSFVSLSERFF